ncbi:MAG: hypothetical protein ABIK92_03610 [Pseudomonadota bacterium]
MKSRKVIMILSLVILVVSCTYSYAIVLAEGTDFAKGVISKINSTDMSVRVDTQRYYFKDASEMERILKTNNISEDQKVIMFYKIIKGKKLIINIMEDKRESFF